MATIVKENKEYEIPDGYYTGKDLKKQFGTGKEVVPVVRSGNIDNVIEPDEVFNVKNSDKVVATTPMEAA